MIPHGIRLEKKAEAIFLRALIHVARGDKPRDLVEVYKELYPEEVHNESFPTNRKIGIGDRKQNFSKGKDLNPKIPNLSEGKLNPRK